MRNDIVAIISPDIHGRDFWKKLIEVYDGSVPVIFLGDYLDPYPHENISVEDAKNNFNELWEFKQKWGDKVILLLGNHDMSYYDNHLQCCRFSHETKTWYSDFLKQHWSDFKISHEIINNNRKFLFSHGGVHKEWLKDNGFEIKMSSDYINSICKENIKSLNTYSFYRGGYDRIGSPIWADIREFIGDKYEIIDDNKDELDVFQIVGHTQLSVDMLNLDNICCIDSRQLFVITNDNQIEKF